MNTFGVNFSTLSVLGKTLVMLAIADDLSQGRKQMEEACCSEDKRKQCLERTVEGRSGIKIRT